MNYNELITETSEKIIAELERGVLPWKKEWSGSGSLFAPFNATTKIPYQGFNVMRLMMSAVANGFSNNQWLTFKQAQFNKLRIKRGSKATAIVRWVVLKNEDDEDSELGIGTSRRQKVIPKVFYVFNLDQVEDCTKKDEYLGTPKTEPLNESERIKKVESIIAENGAKVIEDGQSPHYSPATDEIHVPKFEQFETAGAYADTVLHELAHWTGAKSRLNRDQSGKFGSESYAKEELRAEIASLMICDKVGIEHNVKNQYSYIGEWLKVLKKDKKEIFNACNDASKIVRFLKI